jgi:hypothetical protein
MEYLMFINQDQGEAWNRISQTTWRGTKGKWSYWAKADGTFYVFLDEDKARVDAAEKDAKIN